MLQCPKCGAAVSKLYTYTEQSITEHPGGKCKACWIRFRTKARALIGDPTVFHQKDRPTTLGCKECSKIAGGLYRQTCLECYSTQLREAFNHDPSTETWIKDLHTARALWRLRRCYCNQAAEDWKCGVCKESYELFVSSKD